MRIGPPRLLLSFSVLYVIHVAYGIYYLDRVEGVTAWFCPLIFLVGLNALGFLVWVTSHRWVSLGNILIHLVGSLGEVRNILAVGWQDIGMVKLPMVATHSLMVLIFLLIYLRSK